MIEYWVIPPEADAEFVANMEEVPEVYDPGYPAVCMDEQPVHLLKETRVRIKATKTHGQRVDYEYERNGTASIFMFAGYLQVTARPQRTKVDWALEVGNLLDTRYADCEWITLVMDNLKTHTMRGVLRSLPARTGHRLHSTNRVLLHTEARQLAEHCGMRAELHEQPVPQWPAHRRPRLAAV